MAETQDTKANHAEIGRTGLYKAVRLSAGANWMEKNYQSALGDLKVKDAYEGMAKEVADLPGEEKLAEILARFILVMLMQTRPEQQPMVLWQLYTHMRATDLLPAVKPNVGSIVDLTGRLIPPKEG
jgi:hypothetical protein